jgi:hypothetical protein
LYRAHHLREQRICDIGDFAFVRILVNNFAFKGLANAYDTVKGKQTEKAKDCTHD